MWLTAQLTKMDQLKLISNKSTSVITHTFLSSSLETHHKRLEVSSILDLPTHGSSTKRPHWRDLMELRSQRNSHMMRLLPPPIRRLTKELLFNSDLVLLWVISSQMMLDLDHAMDLNQADKSTLRTKNSVMSRNRRQSSEETTSRLSLVWLIQLLLKVA